MEVGSTSTTFEPWPKHPCIGQTYQAPEPGIHFESMAPAIPIDSATPIVAGLAAATVVERPVPDSRLAALIWSHKGSQGIHFVLREISIEGARLHLLFTKSLPNALKQGAIVAIAGEEISFFELRKMVPKALTYWRFASSDAFLMDLVTTGE